jgi:hypothetical protein
MKNLLLLLENSNNNNSTKSFLPFLKNLKNLVKKKIGEIEVFEGACNLIYESTKHKMKLELQSNSQHFENLEREVKDHKIVLEQEKTDYNFIEEKFKQLEQLGDLFENSCKDSASILETSISNKKEEISMSKMIREFSRKDMDKIAKLNKDSDEEDES